MFVDDVIKRVTFIDERIEPSALLLLLLFVVLNNQ